MLVEKCTLTYVLRQWHLSWGNLLLFMAVGDRNMKNLLKGAPCMLVFAQISSGWGAELRHKCQRSVAHENSKSVAESMLMGTCMPAAQLMLDLFGAGAYQALTHLWLGTA